MDHHAINEQMQALADLLAPRPAIVRSIWEPQLGAMEAQLEKMSGLAAEIEDNNRRWDSTFPIAAARLKQLLDETEADERVGEVDALLLKSGELTRQAADWLKLIEKQSSTLRPVDSVPAAFRAAYARFVELDQRYNRAVTMQLENGRQFDDFLRAIRADAVPDRGKRHSVTEIRKMLNRELR